MKRSLYLLFLLILYFMNLMNLLISYIYSAVFYSHGGMCLLELLCIIVSANDCDNKGSNDNVP
jgi:hypothetical protein